MFELLKYGSYAVVAHNETDTANIYLLVGLLLKKLFFAFFE